MLKNFITKYKIWLFCLILLFSLSTHIAGAGNDSNMHGYMWSPQIGWISMNCADLGVCGVNNFGVSQDEQGYWHGTAWAPFLGWIEFSPTINRNGQRGARAVPNRMIGWGRIISFDYQSQCATCWNGEYGWLSMSSENGGNVRYGVSATPNSDRTEFVYSGYGWGGGMVLGYVDFSGVRMEGICVDPICIPKSKDDLTLVATPSIVPKENPRIKLEYSTINGNYKACEADSSPVSVDWSGTIEALNPTNGLVLSKTNILVVPDATSYATFRIRCQKQDNIWLDWVPVRVKVVDGPVCFDGDPRCCKANDPTCTPCPVGDPTCTPCPVGDPTCTPPCPIGSPGCPGGPGGPGGGGSNNYCLAPNATTYNISWKSLGTNYVSCKASSIPNLVDWNSTTVITPPTSTSGTLTKTIGLTINQLPATLSLVCKDASGAETSIYRTITGICNSTLNLTPSSQCVSPNQKTVTLTWSNGQNQSLFDICWASSAPTQISWSGTKTPPGSGGKNIYTQSNVTVSAPETNYKLVCTDKNGIDTTSETTVKLCNPLTASIVANPTKLATPGVTKLSWNNTGADYCNITSLPEGVYANSDQNSVIGANSVSGVAVNQTTYFRLYCTQGTRSIESTAKVCVGNDPNCGKSICEAYPNLPFCKKKVPIFEEH